MSRPRQRSAPEPETSRTCKRQATMLDAKEEQEQDGLLLSVTVVLVQNGWIGAREIGRLGVTSRGARWGDAEIWTALCYRSWPNSADIPQGFVRALGGYRSLYRHRSTLKLHQKPRRSPLPPPKLQPDQFDILIDISVGGENAFSGVWHGTELMNNLLEDGSVSYDVENPFVLGCTDCWNSLRCVLPNGDEKCTYNGRCNFDLSKEYDARIHLLRSTDKTSCCVFVPTSTEWVNCNKYDDDDLAYVRLRSVEPKAPKGLIFRQTATAAEIQSRLLHEPVSFGLDISIGGIELSDKIGITGFHVSVLVGEDSEDWKDEGHDMENFDEEMSKKSGVTVLHLVEQLQGVQFNPIMSLPD